MTENERKLVEAEPRIFAVEAIDDEGQHWTVWERKPNGSIDRTLMGWVTEERVRYRFAPGDVYRTMGMDDFVKFGLPELPIPSPTVNLMHGIESARDEISNLKPLRDRPMGDAEIGLTQACLSMTLHMLRRLGNGGASERAYLYGVASLGAAVYELTRRMLNAEMFESVHDHVREILTMANGLDEMASASHDALLERECE